MNPSCKLKPAEATANSYVCSHLILTHSRTFIKVTFRRGKHTHLYKATVRLNIHVCFWGSCLFFRLYTISYLNMCIMYLWDVQHVATGLTSWIRLVVRESKWPPRRGAYCYSILGISPKILTPGTQLINITWVKLIPTIFSLLPSLSSPSHIPLSPAAYILALPPLGCVAWNMIRSAEKGPNCNLSVLETNRSEAQRAQPEQPPEWTWLL